MGGETRIICGPTGLSGTQKILLDRAIYLVRELKEARSQLNKEIGSVGIGMGNYIIRKINREFMVPAKQKELAKIRVQLWGVAIIEEVKIEI